MINHWMKRLAVAFGLLVAIPAVIAFNYFSRKLRVLLGGADQAAHTVLSLVHGADAEKLNPMPEASGSTSKEDA